MGPKPMLSLWNRIASRDHTFSLSISPQPNALASGLCLDQGSEKAIEQLPFRLHCHQAPDRPM